MHIDFRQKGRKSTLVLTELQNGNRIVSLPDFIEAFGMDFEWYDNKRVKRDTSIVNWEIFYCDKHRWYIPEIDEDYVFYKEYDKEWTFLRYSEYCTLLPILPQ